MGGAWFGDRFVRERRCLKCGSRFYSNRSDATCCCSGCRKAYYRATEPRLRDIRCAECSSRSDRGGTCALWERFKGKTHPKGCPQL